MKLTLSALVAVVLLSTPSLASLTGEKGRILEDGTRKGKKNDKKGKKDMNMGGSFQYLQIIHSSDNESNFQDPDTLEEKILGFSSVVRGLQRLARMEGIPSIHVTAGDHTLPGPFYQASAEVPFLGQPGLGDIAMYNAMMLDGNGMGNHEFDGGINEFAYMLSSANYPFIAANLDFSSVVLEPGSPYIGIARDGMECAAAAGMVLKSCYIDVGEFSVGVIGRAPADFFNVVADPDETLPGLDFVGGRNPEDNQPLVSAVGQVLEQVDILTRRGVRHIVLLDHAQDFTGDPLAASDLYGIDVIVSAGSTGFRSGTPIGPFNFLRPEDSQTDPYPGVLLDSEGNYVLLVDTEQLYRYVGNLIVKFDPMGNVVSYDGRSGPIATNSNGVDLLRQNIGAGYLQPAPGVARVFSALQATPTIQDGFAVIGSTATFLNGARADIRSRETNMGRLVADSTIWAAQQYVAAEGLPAVDIALKNGGGIRTSISGPSIIRLSLQAVLAFNNRLSIVELTATQLLAAMENAVSRYPSRDGRFPQVAGMTLIFDPSKDGIDNQETLDTPSRISSLTVSKADGTTDTLVDNFTLMGDSSRTFVMATNNFLLTGGDGYFSLAAGNELGETELGEQQFLEDYIAMVLGGNVDIPDPPAVLSVSVV